MNLCNMSKFDNLIEIAKESAEIKILEEVGYYSSSFLPKNGYDLIMHLGGDWYHNLLLSAGYSSRTIDRKVKNMDFDGLANKLDTWYKTELYPKLYNTFQSQNK